MSFINTNKERFYGDRYFREHVMADDFDWRVKKKELSPYFEERGFCVPMMYDDYYSRLNGIHSDRYISMDLYYMYILPCLNRRDMQKAYADKNGYSILFPDVPQPETVVKNRNGIFYDSSDRYIARQDAIELCAEECDCIIKPTIETGNGVGVERFDASTNETVNAQFEKYERDFIVQRRLRQSAEMARLNSSSLNTMRLFTYRSQDGAIRFLSGKSFLRVGGKGSVKDNGSAGGGMMRVADDGSVGDNVVHFKSMKVTSAKEDYGINGFKIPQFQDAVEIVKSLHRKVWYCDLLGWDIAVGVDGFVFIEMNMLPSCEGPQQLSGPLFEGILDEIMGRISCVRKSNAELSVNRFRDGFDHLLQIGGEDVQSIL